MSSNISLNMTCIFVVSFTLLIIGIIMVLKKREFYAKSKIIKGTVIDIKEDYVCDSRSYFPIIEYYDEFEQKNNTYESNTGSNPCIYNVGDTIELRYYRDENKKTISINTWLGIFGGPVFLIATSIFVLFILSINLANH